MLSPVCTPIGSMFSILHIVMQLSALSRITSYSSSFQPTIDFSMRTWVIGLAARPPFTISSNSSSLVAIPPPVPPSVYAGRTTNGRPISRFADMASSILLTVKLGGTGSPISASIFLNRSLSSAFLIVSMRLPSNRTLCLSNTPASCSSIARLRPV